MQLTMLFGRCVALNIPYNVPKLAGTVLTTVSHHKSVQYPNTSLHCVQCSVPIQNSKVSR